MHSRSHPLSPICNVNLHLNGLSQSSCQAQIQNQNKHSCSRSDYQHEYEHGDQRNNRKNINRIEGLFDNIQICQDFQILLVILKNANDKYMKQSRIYKKSNFSILRVLSSYKDLMDSNSPPNSDSLQLSVQHAQSLSQLQLQSQSLLVGAVPVTKYKKQQIYNWIIYITKNYNPQNYQGWLKAVYQLNKQNASINPIKNDSKYINEGSNGHNKPKQKKGQKPAHKYSLNYNSNLNKNNSISAIPASKYQNKKSTCDNFCCQKYGKCQNSQYQIMAPISSKIHYISFEPDIERENQSKQFSKQLQKMNRKSTSKSTNANQAAKSNPKLQSNPKCNNLCHYAILNQHQKQKENLNSSNTINQSISSMKNSNYNYNSHPNCHQPQKEQNPKMMPKNPTPPCCYPFKAKNSHIFIPSSSNPTTSPPSCTGTALITATATNFTRTQRHLNIINANTHNNNNSNNHNLSFPNGRGNGNAIGYMEDLKIGNFINRDGTHGQEGQSQGNESFVKGLDGQNGNFCEGLEQQIDSQWDTEQRDLWEIMNTRAKVFREINYKMKAFSALIANFQAFQIFQEINYKMKHFQYKIMLNRFLRNYSKFVSFKNQKNSLNKRSEKFYSQNLLKKSFKILSIFYELKISPRSKKKIDLSKLNPINYLFILTTIFSPFSSRSHVEINPSLSISLSSHQFQPYLNPPSSPHFPCYPASSLSDPSSPSPKSLRSKLTHHQSLQNLQKIELISQYFTNNNGFIKISKQNLRNLFKLYNESRMKKCYKILTQNVKQYQPQQETLIKTIKKSGFSKMLTQIRTLVHKKSILTVMKVTKQKLLQIKSFNILVENALSRKMYEKRKQFLEIQTKNRLMGRVLKIWKERKIEREIKKLGYLERVEKGFGIVWGLWAGKWMGVLKRFSKQQAQREEKQQYMKQMQIYKNIFSFLKNRVNERNLHIKIKNLNSNSIKATLFSLWHKKTKIFQALHKLQKYFFRLPFNLLLKNSILFSSFDKTNKLLENRKLNNFYRQLRINYNLDNIFFDKMNKKIQNAIKLAQIGVFIKAGRKIKIQIDNQKKLKEININAKKIQGYINYTAKANALGKLRFYCKKQIGLRQTIKITNSILGNRNIVPSHTLTPNPKALKIQFFSLLIYSSNLFKSTQKLTNFLTHQRQQFFKKQFNTLRHRSSIQKLIESKKKQREYGILQKIYFDIKKEVQIKKEKYNELELKYNGKLLWKGMLSLAGNVMYMHKKIEQLKLWLKTNKKNLKIKSLLSHLKQKRNIRNKSLKLALTSTLNFLRSSLSPAQPNSIQSLWISSQNLSLFLKNINFNLFLNSYKLSLKNHKIAQKFARNYKKLAIFKINCAVRRYILKKKENYMTIKFRAMQLARVGFWSIARQGKERRQKSKQKQRNQRQKSFMAPQSILAQSKKYRIHEHISTQYSSL